MTAVLAMLAAACGEAEEPTVTRATTLNPRRTVSAAGVGAGSRSLPSPGQGRHPRRSIQSHRPASRFPLHRAMPDGGRHVPLERSPSSRRGNPGPLGILLPSREGNHPLKAADSSLPPDAGTDGGLWTVPNLISSLRIAAIPVFLWVLLARDNYGLAAILLGVIAWTDYLDGVLARKLGQVSEIGKFLDPLADRLVVFASVVGGLLADVVPPWLGWPLLVREVAIGLVAIYLVLKFKVRVDVRPLGKIATGLVFGAVPLFYLTGTGFFPDVWRWSGTGIGAAGLVLYLIVSWQYLGDLRRSVRLPGRKPSEP